MVQTILGKKLKCWICDAVHNFKLSSEGLVICNGNFIKLRDEHGDISLSPDLNKDLRAFEIDEIPTDLILRSLPVNVELCELMSEQQKKQTQYNMLKYISKYVKIDKLSKRQARYYLSELCSITDNKNPDFTLNLEGEEVNTESLMKTNMSILA